MRGRRSPAALGAVALLAVAGSGAKRPATPPAAASGPAIVVAQVPASALPAETLAGGTLRASLGEGGRLLLVTPDGQSRVLTGGFESAADPDVSFDGQSILFAGRKQKTDPWCVWEMKADAGTARQITCGKAGARQPVYQSTVYTITATYVEPWVQVAFVGRDGEEWDEAGVAPNTSLWSCKTDGNALRRLTYNLSNDLDPVILPDGRMLYAGWLRHTSRHGPQGRLALLGVNEDGTDYQTYLGEQGLRVQQMPAPTADGRVVFVESDALGGDGAGQLAAVSQVRPLHSYQPLTGASDGRFRSPAPLPDGRLLVAWRAGEEGTFSIQRFDPQTKAREKVIADPAWHSLQAKLLAAHPMPDARSSVVREDDASGKLYTIDVDIHDLGDKLKPGTAKSLRVVEGVPGAGKPASRRLLGSIPLAEDGSFQVQVPANTPLQLQLVDAEGLAIRSSAWLWVRNHAAQGCVGCHEDPERTPPNRFVKALQSAAPVLDAPPEKRKTVGYAADVKPILETKCLTCHGPGGKGPRFDAGSEGIVTPGEARRSRLVWHLLGRNTARPWDPEATAPGPKNVTPPGTLTPDEVRALLEWIDLGGQP